MASRKESGRKEFGRKESGVEKREEQEAQAKRDLQRLARKKSGVFGGYANEASEADREMRTDDITPGLRRIINVLRALFFMAMAIWFIRFLSGRG